MSTQLAVYSKLNILSFVTSYTKKLKKIHAVTTVVQFYFQRYKCLPVGMTIQAVV